MLAFRPSWLVTRVSGWSVHRPPPKLSPMG
jgi:hypothetical protein